MKAHFLFCNCIVLLASFAIKNITCPKFVDRVKDSITKCGDCLTSNKIFELERLDLKDGRLYSPARIIMSDDFTQISFMGVDAYSDSKRFNLIMEATAKEITNRVNRDCEGVFFNYRTTEIVNMSAKFKRPQDAERFCIMYHDDVECYG